MRALRVAALAALPACGLDYDLAPSLTPDGGGRTVIDGFIQLDELRHVDVLVVMDGSGSMSDDADNVGQGVLQLKLDIAAVASEWSITFITADSDALHPQGPYTGADDDIDILMAPGLMPSTRGEAGFAAAYAYDRQNPGTFHPDADLLIFLISDEDEQSGIQPALFKEWMDSLKTPPRRADAVPIVSTTTACSPDVGFKYIELARLQGKQAVDLCDPGWMEWLSQTSFLTARLDRLTLSELPIESTLRVRIDGRSSDDWAYVADENTIYFGEVPPGGAEVVAEYIAR